MMYILYRESVNYKAHLKNISFLSNIQVLKDYSVTFYGILVLIDIETRFYMGVIFSRNHKNGKEKKK